MRFFTASLAAFMTFAAPISAAEIFAKRTLRVGTILNSGDLQIHGDIEENRVDQIIGQEVRRAVYAGHRVTIAHIGPPTLVQRNEVVVMVFKNGGLGIRTEGRALSRGGKGEVVDVMNLTSRTTVRAVVTGHRQVEVRR